MCQSRAYYSCVRTEIFCFSITYACTLVGFTTLMGSEITEKLNSQSGDSLLRVEKML